MVSFKADVLLKKGQLVSGNVYVWKDGHVRLYLGMAKKTKELVFYTVGRMAFIYNGDNVLPLWGDRQVCSLLGMCNSIFSVPYNFSAISTYRDMPSIYGSIGAVYSEEVIEDWLSRNRHGGLLAYSK